MVRRSYRERESREDDKLWSLLEMGGSVDETGKRRERPGEEGERRQNSIKGSK